MFFVLRSRPVPSRSRNGEVTRSPFPLYRNGNGNGSTGGRLTRSSFPAVQWR